MNLLERIEHWGDTHHPKWMDIVRIALGIFLVYKGFTYLNNLGELNSLISTNTSFGSLAILLAGHYIVFAHLVGGFLLVLGMLTRFACLIQIPILIGAVLFINTNDGVFRPYSELLLSILVLGLLIYFLIAGNGKLAVQWPEEERKQAVFPD